MTWPLVLAGAGFALLALLHFIGALRWKETSCRSPKW